MKKYTLLSFDNSSTYFEELSAALQGTEIKIVDVAAKEEALEFLMDAHADVILIYITLDSVEILEFLENIHNDIENRETPVILISYLEDYDHLSSTLKEHNIVSLFTYKSYLHQLKNLLKFLRSIDLDKDALESELIESETRNILDPLTGAYNRYGAQDKFSQLTSRVKAYQEPFSLIMLDIDYFKKVNDTYGHNIGDQALISLCDIIKNSIRKHDALIRFGGEEFFIFLSNTNITTSTKIANKLRTLIKERTHTEKKLSITASFGVVEYHENEEMSTLTKRADLLLYKAKSEGRDRVVAE